VTRAAFSLWNDRIAPVFDVARNLLIVDTAQGAETGRIERRFSGDSPQERAMRLASLQVDHLVCGAITRETADALQDRGIQVVSFVSGQLEQVIQAWLHGHLHERSLHMPGRTRKPHGGNRCNRHGKSSGHSTNQQRED